MAICSCLTLVVGLGPLALIPLDHLPCLQGTGDQRWPHIPTQNSKKANIPLSPTKIPLKPTESSENPTESHRVLRNPTETHRKSHQQKKANLYLWSSSPDKQESN